MPDTAPGRVLASAAPSPGPIAVIRPPPIDPWSIAALVWFAGTVVTLAWQLRNQSRFMADVRRGAAGPAIAGLLRSRMVTPADFEQRFEASEREIILAHEAVHLGRNDARINALAALAHSLCWFNPLIHAGAYFLHSPERPLGEARTTVPSSPEGLKPCLLTISLRC